SSAGAPVTTTIGGAQGTSSGASFWDVGTLANRLDAGTGARALNQQDASIAWTDPSFLRFRDLNLLRLRNPLAAMLPKELRYGSAADWTTTPSIAWGTAIQDPHGATILWGTSDDDTILWGTSDDDTILWGTSDEGTILWGTSIMTSPDAW